MTSFQRCQCFHYYASRRIVRFMLRNIIWNMRIEHHTMEYNYWLQMCILRSMNEM